MGEIVTRRDNSTILLCIFICLQPALRVPLHPSQAGFIKSSISLYCILYIIFISWCILLYPIYIDTVDLVSTQPCGPSPERRRAEVYCTEVMWNGKTPDKCELRRCTTYVYEHTKQNATYSRVSLFFFFHFFPQNVLTTRARAPSRSLGGHTVAYRIY